MPALMAHEMGHILGSPHDGTGVGTYPPDTTSYNIPGTCPENLYIMTPSQSGTIVEWSECSRRSIDFLYDLREKENPKNGNCFYT
ncbi:venom metalloproteinase antarease-like TpachMP_B [Eurytemora carolleeae]|uniref:venom metalloproteinase antarease-like TpachMP_B n=1 Tax=Eurytemora carolleeae TaxID=1294199 RepID=UPI000C787265|nr:venom metalloproteinase antarease-like TpachMP_B [Eurytemora carolleeae]|eukprot:XP_023329131.1 venom metalloproteinase antarease-like TpachMP_B [Eurytemora affinis]